MSRRLNLFEMGVGALIVACALCLLMGCSDEVHVTCPTPPPVEDVDGDDDSPDEKFMRTVPWYSPTTGGDDDQPTGKAKIDIALDAAHEMGLSLTVDQMVEYRLIAEAEAMIRKAGIRKASYRLPYLGDGNGECWARNTGPSDCFGNPRSVQVCDHPCGRYWHSVVEVDEGIFVHVCGTFDGEVGSCPGQY